MVKTRSKVQVQLSVLFVPAGVKNSALNRTQVVARFYDRVDRVDRVDLGDDVLAYPIRGHQKRKPRGGFAVQSSEFKIIPSSPKRPRW